MAMGRRGEEQEQLFITHESMRSGGHPADALWAESSAKAGSMMGTDPGERPRHRVKRTMVPHRRSTSRTVGRDRTREPTAILDIVLHVPSAASGPVGVATMHSAPSRQLSTRPPSACMRSSPTSLAFGRRYGRTVVGNRRRHARTNASGGFRRVASTRVIGVEAPDAQRTCKHRERQRSRNSIHDTGVSSPLHLALPIASAIRQRTGTAHASLPSFSHEVPVGVVMARDRHRLARCPAAMVDPPNFPASTARSSNRYHGYWPWERLRRPRSRNRPVRPREPSSANGGGSRGS